MGVEWVYEYMTDKGGVEAVDYCIFKDNEAR